MVKISEGYEPLAEVFQSAHDQTALGKGRIRHANAKPFLQQPIFAIGRMVGIGYNVGQAMKKGQEAMRLPDDRAQAELLGAMVYLASAYLLIGERMETEKRAAVAEMDIPTRETARAAFTPVQEEVEALTAEIDFTLPQITVAGTEDECRQKHHEELAEMKNELVGSTKFFIEAWDVLQAARTWRERCDPVFAGGASMAVVQAEKLLSSFTDYNKIRHAKTLALIKNAERFYYAPEVCKVILETKGQRWNPQG